MKNCWQLKIFVHTFKSPQNWLKIIFETSCVISNRRFLVFYADFFVGILIFNKIPKSTSFVIGAKSEPKRIQPVIHLLVKYE